MPEAGGRAIDEALWSHDPESWLPHGLDEAKGAEFATSWIVSDGEANPLMLSFCFCCMALSVPT